MMTDTVDLFPPWHCVTPPLGWGNTDRKRPSFFFYRGAQTC